jgi:NTP pyrophosphatase (non-canonical NTP hydrolase)
MNDPGYLPAIGTPVITTKLGPTMGMLIHSQHLAQRRPGQRGIYSGPVPGHGGDVWIIDHVNDDGTPTGEHYQAYMYTELDYLPDPMDAPGQVDPANAPRQADPADVYPDMDSLLRALAAWQFETFPDNTWQSAYLHLSAEVNELLHALFANDPDKIQEELADVVLLTFAVLSGHYRTPWVTSDDVAETFFDIVRRKFLAIRDQTFVDSGQGYAKRIKS